LDAKSGAELARWPVGPHPNEMALSSDGRLFVAEANTNTVSVLDLKTGRVLETLSTSPASGRLRARCPTVLRSHPTADCCLWPTLTTTAWRSSISPLPAEPFPRPRPVGWFPTSVRVTADGSHLGVANGKVSLRPPIPPGPFSGDPRPRALQDYIGSLFHGTVSLIPLPAAADRAATFGRWTAEVIANQPVAHHARSAKQSGARHAG